MHSNVSEVHLHGFLVHELIICVDDFARAAAIGIKLARFLQYFKEL